MLRFFILSLISISLNLLAQEVDVEIIIKDTHISAKLDKGNETLIFRGIPYAIPPVGDLRWKSPLPIESSQSIDARFFKPACMQDRYNVDWYHEVIRAFNSDTSLFSNVNSTSEDCLYLNIWTKPFENSEKKKPVMVWIHGGNDVGGWSYEPDYFGHNLAKKDVIVVSIAYRLNIFGFFKHPEMETESGNFGLEDQILALKWIQDNIKYYGGDSENITLFGESAGGAHISYHISSPLSEGLFHKAIIQSGGYNFTYPNVLIEEKQANNLSTKVQKISLVSNLKDLKKLTAKQLLDISAKLYHPFHPIIDGTLILKRITESFRSGNLNQIDLIIGSNANEEFLYVDKNTNQKEFYNRILQDFPDDIDSILAMLDLSKLRLAIDRYGTNQHTTCPSVFIARSMTKKGNDVYQYLFNKKRNDSQNILSYHGAEIPYIFNTHSDYLPTNNEDIELTKSMMEYWTQFAIKGNPNSPKNSILWNQFGDKENYIVFDSEIKNLTNIENKFCEIMIKKLN